MADLIFFACFTRSYPFSKRVKSRRQAQRDYLEPTNKKALRKKSAHARAPQRMRWSERCGEKDKLLTQ